MNELLRILGRGGPYSYYWTHDHAKPEAKKISHWYATDAIPDIPPGAHSVYFGVQPSKVKKSAHKRAEDDDIAALSCVFADFDVKPDDKPGHYPDISAILDRLERMRSLCWPSAIVFSGGGVQAYWILAEPLPITDANRAMAKDLIERWIKWAGGEPAAGGLPRVLRVPGSVNYKPSYAPDFKPCVLGELNPNRYTVAELEACLQHKLGGIIIPQTRHLTNEEWAWGQIEKQAQRIQTTPHGQRHPEYLRAAYYIGGLTRGYGLDEARAQSMLFSAGEQNSEDNPAAKEARRVIRDAFKKGLERPIVPRPDLWDAPAPVIEPTPAGEAPRPTAAPVTGTWLDDWIEYSRQWAPGAYDGFHAGTGLWLLSSVAARRVVAHAGFSVYPSLYIVLCAQTSLFNKSTATNLAVDFLRQIGLDFLLASDTATPQKFINDLVGYLPDDFHEHPPEWQAATLDRLRFAAQRAWNYDEYGNMLEEMGKRDGVHTEFKTILRRWFDCPPTYTAGTIKRGNEIVRDPYLALLGSATPADMRPFMRRGGAMWGNGFLARTIFISPNGDAPNEAMPPEGKAVPPQHLVTPIRAWHERLGVPEAKVVRILDEDNEPTGKYRLERGPLPQNVMTLDPDVRQEWFNYVNHLKRVAWTTKSDMDAGNTRLANIALRIAMLLASVAGLDRVTGPYWARAYYLTQAMQKYQLNLMESVGDDQGESPRRASEERVLKQLEKRGPMTMRELRRFIYGMSVDELGTAVKALEEAGEVERVKEGKTTKVKICGA